MYEAFSILNSSGLILILIFGLSMHRSVVIASEHGLGTMS
jgi:hypothetical protein